MSVHLQREIEKLKRSLLALSARVEENLRRAVHAIDRHDVELARRVIDADIEIDHAEIDVEEECLKILALHQPVAIDLRLVIACLKINNDLERVGDLAVNIAERALFLADLPRVNAPFDFPTMADKAQAMVRNSLDALIHLDAALARSVCAADDEVDAINRQMYEQVQDGIRRQPQALNSLIHLLCVSRHLERIADHATNIAEDVIYMLKGEITRHGMQTRALKDNAPGDA
jgi:phosphate transport system protein